MSVLRTSHDGAGAAGLPPWGWDGVLGPRSSEPREEWQATGGGAGGPQPKRWQAGWPLGQPWAGAGVPCGGEAERGTGRSVRPASCPLGEMPSDTILVAGSCSVSGPGSVENPAPPTGRTLPAQREQVLRAPSLGASLLPCLQKSGPEQGTCSKAVGMEEDGGPPLPPQPCHLLWEGVSQVPAAPTSDPQGTGSWAPAAAPRGLCRALCVRTLQESGGSWMTHVTPATFLGGTGLWSFLLGVEE